MFNNKELNTYHNIKAPEELYSKVIATKNPKRLWLMPMLSTVAACFVLVVAVSFFFQGGEPNIVLNGQKLADSIVFYDISPASDMRSSPVFAVPVQLELSRKAEISVSHGCMTVDGGEPATELTASSSVTLLWEIERSEVMPLCVMEIRDENGVTTVTLEYNNAEITATKRRLK